jgi:Domain of unknown function (DUF4276)
MTLFIGSIVEGETETQCVPAILKRIWYELLAQTEVVVPLPPARQSRDQLVNDAYDTLAANILKVSMQLQKKLKDKSNDRGVILILLDAEDDCPATLGPRLLVRASSARSDAKIACVLAKRSLENWIVAGAASLQGVNGLLAAAPIPEHAEEQSGVAWLKKQLATSDRSRSYSKVTDAKIFFRDINLAECRLNSPSFDKLCRELEKWTQ